MSLSGRHVIAGIGHTAFGKLPGSDTVSLNVEACRNALADAGVDKSLVDAVFVKVPTSAHQFMVGQKVAEALGIAPRMGGAWDQGGAANITLLSFAIMAIEAGQCDVALVCYADNPRTGNRAHFGRLAFREVSQQVGAPIATADHSDCRGCHEPDSAGGPFGEITRAGFPATVACAGTSLVTTAPAPTMARSPMLRLQRITAPEPMLAPLPTTVGWTVQSSPVCNEPSGLVARGCLSLMKMTP